METAIKTADPDRWARYLLRRGQEAEAEEEERANREPEAAAPTALEDGKADSAGEDDDGWEALFEGLEEEEVSSGSSGLVGSSCLLYTSPSPRDMRRSRMPSSA